MFYCPLSSRVSYENSTFILIVTLYVMHHFFFTLKNFFLIFDFQQFDYGVGGEYSSLCTQPVWVFWASSVYTSTSFIQIGKFSTVLSSFKDTYSKLHIQLPFTFHLPAISHVAALNWVGRREVSLLWIVICSE